jgi:predicted deacylase
MISRATKASIDLTALTRGFHHRRFQARNVGFDAYIWCGGPGPVLLLNGATHGDEYEGPTLLRHWAAHWRPADLHGTVVVVPVLNERAFYAGARCDPVDGGNLARAFPGAARGPVTSRLAHLFDTRLLAQCTHYVDLHSAGSAYELFPWVGYMTRDDEVGRAQRAMAACFDVFWCWAGPFLPGRTLSAAHVRNIPAIYVECRGAGGITARDLRALDRGLRNLLIHLGCVPAPRAAQKLRPQRIRIATDANEAHLQVHHLAPHAGLFAAAVTLRARVRRGQLIGRVRALDSLKESSVRAEGSGCVVMLRRQRSVQRGDALLTLAPI